MEGEEIDVQSVRSSLVCLVKSPSSAESSPVLPFQPLQTFKPQGSIDSANPKDIVKELIRAPQYIPQSTNCQLN